MSGTLHRRLLVLETAGQANNTPRLVLVCRAGREGDTLSGINRPDGHHLHRLPGESMDSLKARARASIRGPGLAVVFACYGA